MKRILLLLVVSSFTVNLCAQDAIEYKTPPKNIYDLVMAKPTPGVTIDRKGNWMLLTERSSMPGVEDLAQPELRVAGLRINPNNFGPSRAIYIINFKIKDIKSGNEHQITNLPANLKASNVRLNPDQTKIGFTHTTAKSIDLYVIDVATKKATKWNKVPVNSSMGTAFDWVDNNSLIYAGVNKSLSMSPVRSLAPKGPVVQENLGKVAASRTYQDLIKNSYDESLFEFYATTQLIRNTNGAETKVGSPTIYSGFNISPDRKYVLVQKIEKPFSYLVPAWGFPLTVMVTDINGKEIKTLAKIPSQELAPTGFDNTLNAPSNFDWLTDRAATIVWIEPLDSGLIKKKMDHHDVAYILPAPFTTKKELIRTAMRIRDISAINENIILVSEGSSAKHRVKLNKLNPQTGAIDVLFDRSTDDAYNDPGAPVTAINSFGRASVKLVNDSEIWMRGTGSSPKGDLPFLAAFDLNTKKSRMLWRAEDPYYESVTNIIDFDKMIVVTSRQSENEPPNFYMRDLKNNTMNALTNFPDPQPGLRGVMKQKIRYKRKDGVDLTADLYLPKGYDPKRDGRLPVFIWAYPREFKSAADAAQVRGSKNTFTRVSSGQSLFWVTQGYAVMDNTEFPIVGEGENQPNDNFVDQLTWNAEAAIDKIHDMGIGDKNRVGVGGHSYGAFMTANLLAHTKLFKAGIARSGAYNRTLTPFGFQAEERTYWQAPDVYNRMSPFSHADKIKTPLLLIHGEADNNSGTFPIQSERLYNAVKGHGGIVRYVLLPFESHGYTAKENVLHMLWEMTAWLDKYVKGKS